MVKYVHLMELLSFSGQRLILMEWEQVRNDQSTKLMDSTIFPPTRD